jgi:hypothetical protein
MVHQFIHQRFVRQPLLKAEVVITAQAVIVTAACQLEIKV